MEDSRPIFLSYQSQECGCKSLFKLQNRWHKPSMALDSGFPRQSLTGAGSAGMTTFVVMAEDSLLIRLTLEW